jgi:hypothetical protein
MNQNITKKSYLEAALTPPSSPENIFLKNKQNLGIIDIRLKWYLNKINIDETCGECQKGIDEDEWNSYYKLYIIRYIDCKDEMKIKITNDKNNNNDYTIYCDSCKSKIISKFNEDKKLKELLNPYDKNNMNETLILSTPIIKSLPTPLISALSEDKINDMPSLIL